MDFDKFLQEIKLELEKSKPIEQNINILPKSPINESSYKNIGDFGVINQTHKDGHKGIDMGAPKGTQVFPILPGKVKKVGVDPKGGNVVIMDHEYNNSTYKSYYAHLDTINCKIGDVLNQDDVLGTVGDSGNAKGRAFHLHLQVWKDNKLINPATLFKFKQYLK